MSLLETMKLTSVASLTLGLLFGIIVLLFVVISILLIYSLLMISVETKTFENGVLRMVGLSKVNCISMIVIQSFIFVLPSILFAYGMSIPSLMFLYGHLLRGQNVEILPIPALGATVQALVLGFLIPFVSSVLPIQAALDKQLNESLSNSRSKTKG